ncbi:MAG: hypothetical protein RIT26_1455 [Pseudomonadota bacterium]
MPMKFPTRRILPLLWAAISALPAGAITLGEPQVLSADGNAWVAEVPLRALPAGPLDQIQVRLAPASAWALAQRPAPDPRGVQLSLRDGPAGPVLRIEATGASGFVDLLIELLWPRGRMVREIGVLLDSAAQTRFQAHARVPGRLAVEAGDTASALALSHLAPGVSMAQALLALQQANPEAFVGGNVNRLRAGATLKLPSADQVKAIDIHEAREAMALQMEEFALYRAELAARSAPEADPAPQVASGRVQTPQRDKPADPGDRLTLSAPGATDGDQIAAQRQAEQTAQRAAEVNRNIQELNRWVQSGQPGDASGPGNPLPPVTTPPTSASLEAWTQHPQSTGAAAALVLVLAGWILWRARARSVQGSDPNPGGSADGLPLKVDFDLDLPAAHTLPPLSGDLQQPPTPVPRVHLRPPPGAQSTGAQSTGAGPINPMAGISLDLPAAATPSPRADADAMPTDPQAIRWALMQLLWARGLGRTARVLAQEMQAQSDPEWSERAGQWLNERH